MDGRIRLLARDPIYNRDLLYLRDAVCVATPLRFVAFAEYKRAVNLSSHVYAQMFLGHKTDF